MFQFNSKILKYYSILVTLLLAATVYVGYSFYNEASHLAFAKTQLNSKIENLNDKLRPELSNKAPEDTKPCTEWVGTGTSIPNEEICFYDGIKDIQTYADVQVWSYSDNKWVEPVGTGNPEVKTVLRPNNTELGYYYPIVIKCPWGCTLGYTE